MAQMVILLFKPMVLATWFSTVQCAPAQMACLTLAMPTIKSTQFTASILWATAVASQGLWPATLWPSVSIKAMWLLLRVAMSQWVYKIPATRRCSVVLQPLLQAICCLLPTSLMTWAAQPAPGMIFISVVTQFISTMLPSHPMPLLSLLPISKVVLL